MPKRSPHVEPLIMVLVDPKDLRNDRLVPRSVVLQKYHTGEVDFDFKNGSYRAKDPQAEWLKAYPRR